MSYQMFEDEEVPTTRFTGIFIPVEIMEIEELTLTEIHLLSWVDALYSKQHGGCFASNSYFAKRLRVKENTISKSITKLKKLDLIEEVSFNGRQRVIRAKINEYVARKQKSILGRHGSKSKSALDLNPSLTTTKILPSSPGKNSRHNIHYSKVDIKDDISPHTPQRGSAAKAAARVNEKNIHTKKIDDLFEQFIATIHASWPNYVVKKPENIRKSLEKMLQEGRSPDVILKTLDWAVKDNVRRGEWSGWASKILTENPAAYLRGRFDNIHAASETVTVNSRNPTAEKAKRARSIAQELYDNAIEAK